MAVKIITDSSADLTLQLKEKHDIEVIPLTILFPDGSEYLDGVDITKSEFYSKMASFNTLPKTSQPTQPAFMETFNKYLEKGDEIVAVFISSELSGTYQAAKMAKEDIGSGKIEIIDSRAVAFGLCNVVMEAVRLRDLGLNAAEIAKEMNEIKNKAMLYAMIGTLKNLQMGGRLSGGAAFVGGLLGIKPIATVHKAGTVTVAGKERGVRRAFDFIIKRAIEEGIDTTRPVTVGHSNSPSAMKEFIDYVKDKLPGVDITAANECEMGATVGVHLGEGTVGISYFMKNA